MSATSPQPGAPSGTSRGDVPGQIPEVHVGDYRLLTKIGEGGMGVVHLAQAPDGRRVALKVLRPHIIGDDEARERLSREVASLRLVRSPRIAEVLDADPWGPTPFVATRYVPGLSLHEHARQVGPVTGEDLRWFAQALAEAVTAVHGVGVLHRDIKPSNVLLEGRSPVLIDFGLARLAEDPRMTVTGWLLGTPGYLAPEILYGEEATTSSDVHSWAATVVFAATGRPPFGRGPAMAIMDRVRRAEHDLSGVPSELLPLVQACLAPDPARRPDLSTVLDRLRAPAAGALPGAPAPGSDFTMPFAVAAAGPDPDATEVVGPTGGPFEAPTIQQPLPQVVPPLTASLPAVTTPLTAPVPSATQPPAPVAGATPYPQPVRPTAHQPARAPYMQPSPPLQQPARGKESGTARTLRACVLGGLFALVTVGFAAAPYVTLGLLGLAALTTRTFSWTSEAARNRQYRRGRRRWYDGALAAASSPWYLLVATGGTLLLLAWAATLSFAVGLGLMLFRAPTEPGLLVMGAVLALTLWWGPGARRLRGPTRSLVTRAARNEAAGALVALSLAVAVAVTVYQLSTAGVSWTPQPGPPWRSGTLLGQLLAVL